MTDSKINNMKHIRHKSLLTLALIGIIVASCSKENQKQFGDNMTYLPISDIEVHPLGDDIPVSYTSESEWTVDTNVDWIQITPTTGKPGTTAMNIVVKPNISNDRDAEIKFSIGGVEVDRFTITQDKAVLNVLVDSLDFGWIKSEKTFKVESNIQWKIQLNDNESDKEQKFKVTSHELDEVVGMLTDEPKADTVVISSVENNLSEKENSSKITIVPFKSGEEGVPSNIATELSRTINVSQDYLIFLINYSRENLNLDNFSELGNNYVQGDGCDFVNANDHVCNREFTILSEMDWDYNVDELEAVGGRLEADGEGKDTIMGGRNVKLQKMVLYMDEPNPTRESRSFDLIFRAKGDSTASRTVTVTQKAYKLDLDDKIVAYVNEGGTDTINIETAGPWEIKEKSDWLSVSPVAGVGDTQVIIAAPRNLDTKTDLEGVVEFTTPIVPKIVSELSVEQDRFVFTVDEDKSLHNLSRLDTVRHEIKITSSGPWELELSLIGETDEVWLDIPGLQLENGKYYCDHGCDTTIYIKATSFNPNLEEDRKMNVKVQSTLHRDSGEDLNHNFNVVQERFRFDIQKSVSDLIEFNPSSFAAYKSRENENTQKFYLKCSAKWKISSDEDWLTFDPMSGNGEYCDVKMIASTNKDTSRVRIAKVIISADVDGDGVYGDKERTIEVTQDNFVFNVESAPDYTFNPWNADSVPIKVNSTAEAEWTVSSEDYVEISCEKGSGSDSFTFKPNDNGDLTKERSGRVIVTSKVLDCSHIISYTQKKYEFKLSSDEQLTFDELSESYKKSPKEVQVTCSGDWIVDAPDWVDVDRNGTGNKKLSFQAKDNVSTTKDRIDTVKIISKVGGFTHEEVVKVKQNKFVWNVEGFDPIKEPYKALNGIDERQIKIKSSGDWELLFEPEDETFVTLDNKEGGRCKDKATDVKLTVKENYTTKSRKTTLTLKSNHSDDLKSELKINQKAYEFNVPVDTVTFEAQGDERVFDVKCSGKLKPSTTSSWLDVSITNGILKITAKEYTDAKQDRRAEVTIESEHVGQNQELSKKITIIQSKAEK